MPTPAVSEALLKFKSEFVTLAALSLKELLEEKHLYQKVSMFPRGTQAARNFETQWGEHKGVAGEFNAYVQAFLSQGFMLATTPIYQEPGHDPQLCLLVTNVKLFCSNCGSREAFRPAWYSDATSELLSLRNRTEAFKSGFRVAFANTFQLFNLVFQCQRCEGLPEAFLVKRSALDLVLEGRSPIEHLELPTFIPKEERNWFRDAVIAFQTNKVLAALFYLRTFIEQFARRKTGTQNDKRTGEEILSAYADTLPINVRDSIPSLKALYDSLSAALHTANEDEKLFTSVEASIVEHFDFRRIYKLEEKDRANAEKGENSGTKQ